MADLSDILKYYEATIDGFFFSLNSYQRTDTT